MYKMLRRPGQHRQQFWEVEYVLEGAEQFVDSPINITFSKAHGNLIQLQFEGLRGEFGDNRNEAVYLRPSNDEQLLHFRRFCSSFPNEFIGQATRIPIQVEVMRNLIETHLTIDINSGNGEIYLIFARNDLKNPGHGFTIPFTAEFIPPEYI